MISFQATNRFFFYCLTEISTQRIVLKASTAGSLECRPFSLSQRPEVRRISTLVSYFPTIMIVTEYLTARFGVFLRN